MRIFLVVLPLIPFGLALLVLLRLPNTTEPLFSDAPVRCCEGAQDCSCGEQLDCYYCEMGWSCDCAQARAEDGL
jgi:hypothetical protein